LRVKIIRVKVGARGTKRQNWGVGCELQGKKGKGVKNEYKRVPDLKLHRHRCRKEFRGNQKEKESVRAGRGAAQERGVNQFRLEKDHESLKFTNKLNKGR